MSENYNEKKIQYSTKNSTKASITQLTREGMSAKTAVKTKTMTNQTTVIVNELTKIN